MNTSLHIASTFFLLAVAACSGDSTPAGSDGGAPTSDGAQPSVDAISDTCQFRPNTPQWVVEGSEISIQINCQSGESLGDLSIDNLPAGAILDTNANTITWTPGKDQAAVYSLHLNSDILRAEQELTIGVADNFEDPANLPIVDPSQYTMELGLPVIFIDHEPSNASTFEDMTVTYRGKTFTAEAKKRGKSSLNYPKKSYALRFDKFERFNESEFANFENRTRVILTSTFDDNSYIRQRMAYDLWAQFGTQIQVTAYNAVVYRGTEYRGIYTVTDHINGELMQRSGLSVEGNLYKAEDHDANFRLVDYSGNPKITAHQGYSKTEGKPKTSFADMDELVTFVNDSGVSTFDNGIAELIEVDDYVAWWMHVTFILAGDSAGKNTYHYHDQSRKWHMSPWDFNHSFGQDWQSLRSNPEEYKTFFRNNELFQRLTEHPTIGPALRLRYKEALETGPFSKANLNSMIDAYAAEIRLAALRDEKRWRNEYLTYESWDYRDDFNDHLGELEYIRSWLNTRWDYAYGLYTQEL